jgi:hypothetical protein
MDLHNIKITVLKLTQSILCLHQSSLGNGSQQPRLLSFRTHVPTCWRLSRNQSQSHTYFRLAVYRQSVHLGAKPLEIHDQYLFQLNTCDYSPYVISSLTTGWICCLQLLLVLNSAVILSRDGSIIITTGNGMDGRGSVPGRAKKLFSTPQCPDRLWGPPSLLHNGYCRSLARW